MSTIDDLYPISCPFCNIASAYPPNESSPVPRDPDPNKVDPQCYLLLSAPHVLAFLDILPIAPGHILLTTRQHYKKLDELYAPSAGQDWATQRSAAEARESARALGEYLPVLSRALCKVTGIEDWNIVQNNGERAAQVVPHIHFHLIPRYQEGRRENAGKGNANWGTLRSWRMFGRGAREDLDEEEAEEIAGALRKALREEIESRAKL